MQNPQCPLCSGEPNIAFEAKGYPIFDCASCKHRFAISGDSGNHLNQVYGDEYFTGGGAGYSDYLQEGEMLHGRGVWYAKRLKKHLATGRMLDVGAAAGFILKGFTDEGWQGLGVEPNDSMAAHGRQTLGLEIATAGFETFTTNKKFDLISMIQVVAHFQEPRTAFEKARELVAHQGHLLIETWNRESLTARLFGKNWHEYSPPSVLQWFSQNGLTDFLGTLGLEIVSHGHPPKKISGEHAKSLLRYRLGDRSALNSLVSLIPDKINFPYPAEDLFWALYKKRD